MHVISRARISVKKSPVHGWGVFADQYIKKGQLIEQCPLLVDDFGNHMGNYTFHLEGSDSEKHSGFALGYGSLYNHSDRPNARYQFDVDNKTMHFLAEAPIRRGDEIFVSYGDAWFSARKTLPLQATEWFQRRAAIKRIRRMCLGTSMIVLAIVLIRDLSVLFFGGN